MYTEEQTITPVRNTEGEITHFIGIKQDIAGREHNEQVMLDYERLKARFQQEQEQMSLIQRTIAALNHDLRTPFSVISTSKYILSEHFDKLTLEKRQEKLDAIEHQLQYALELLDDTVLVVRSNLNGRGFNPQPVNLAALCQVSAESVGQTKQDGPRIIFTNLGQVGVVRIDEILVSRILLNLLSNAVKYSSPDGSAVRLELTGQDSWLTLRVIDQGIGIQPDDLEHVFEPFFRAENVGKVGGTGLGLSIVKDCVDRHQGRIHAESVPGKGTTFTVELPVSPPDDVDAGE